MSCFKDCCVQNQFLKLEFNAADEMFFKWDVDIERFIEKKTFFDQDLNTIFRINFFFCKKTYLSENHKHVIKCFRKIHYKW